MYPVSIMAAADYAPRAKCNQGAKGAESHWEEMNA